jgi:hypothetical protein
MNRSEITVAMVVFLTVSSALIRAQDKRPDQNAVVDTFKQKIQETLTFENSHRGVEHATVNSAEGRPPSAKTKWVHKDGTPCNITFHASRCYEGWVDGSGTEYANSAGKPCYSARQADSCLIWSRHYSAIVSKYSFDVKATDSLITPYTGILSYTDVSWFTVDHATKEAAEKDDNFTSSLTDSFTFTYGYQDGQWKLLK